MTAARRRALVRWRNTAMTVHLYVTHLLAAFGAAYLLGLLR
jgi:hypothetical protein